MKNKITNKKKIMEHLKLDGHIHGNTYIRIVDSCVNMILFRQLFLHKYKRLF